MSDDLLKRLRTENSMMGYYDSPVIQIEAADEIERLRAENRQLRKALGKIATLHWYDIPANIARAALGEEKK